jgi:uncharacterized protein (DUF302 family)
MAEYALSRTLDCNFDTAVERLTDSLKNEGFGILTEINLDQVFKDKLGKDFKRYKIIGACNPKFAYDAITKEEDIGLILPCKLAVQYVSDDETRIVAIESKHLFNFIGNPALNCIRDDIRMKMELAIKFA